MARTLVADQSGRLARERILQAALELFSERSYGGTSLAAIAKRVGLSQPGLLHHFSDKRSLLIAVLEERDRQDGQADEHGLYDGLTIAQTLEQMVRSTERNLGNRDAIRLAHVCGLASGEGAEAASEWSRRRLARMRAQILERGTAAQETGEIADTVDVENLASVIIAAFLGLEHQWLLDENFDMVGGMRAFTRMLAGELGVPGPA
ncbi:helix-turn-helix domain-containing protein [Nocardia sp. CDC160]|uniref:helix-turn-helix domain-containing protein n=1 Tax=Nocardia sp. CDC160 TaxID=3112166 RepID=UPI002DB5D61A|nr:helix-turn-helix domain-containing protein [Nocardia sp. CDC160]MEC3916796.1 helix-turn-helix domain-containing protein [Nocardia sp. CDC160]